MTDAPTPALDAIERAMVLIRRSQTRRTIGRLAMRQGVPAFDIAMASVMDAIEEGPAGADREVTVGLVAERLGVDPSRASRLVAGAIQAAYVARVASQADGRRIGLELTPAGHELAQAAHRFRRAVFATATRDWSEREREEFASLLTRFVDGLAGDLAG